MWWYLYIKHFNGIKLENYISVIAVIVLYYQKGKYICNEKKTKKKLNSKREK